MTTPAADIFEFLDLMPHVVGVHSKSRRDNFGRPIAAGGQGWLYHCLVQEQETRQGSAEATTTGVSLTAYLNPWGFNLDTNQYELRPVQSDDLIGIVNPAAYASRTIVASIATYYDETSNSHNQIVRFE